MSVKGLTQKQEEFARLLAVGLSQAEAYRAAGYKSKGDHVHENASTLAKQQKVIKRVDDLRAAIRPKVHAALAVTQASVTAMLAQTYDDARLLGQASAAVQASLGIAKLHGLLIDRVEDVTRRATRDPRAPVEIEVEHWVTEQTGLLLGAPAPEPQSPKTNGHSNGGGTHD